MADAPEYLSLVIAFTVSWLLVSLMVTTLTRPDFFRFQVQGQNEWIHADFVLLRVHGHGKLQGMSCSLRLVGNRGFWCAVNLTGMLRCVAHAGHCWLLLVASIRQVHLPLNQVWLKKAGRNSGSRDDCKCAGPRFDEVSLLLRQARHVFGWARPSSVVSLIPAVPHLAKAAVALVEGDVIVS